MEQNPDGVSDTAARAARDLTVVFNRLRRRLRSVAEDEDLTPPQVSALTLVGKHGAATASALASAEGVRPQSMATTLAALDRAGLIHRNPDPEDGRRQLITLTPRAASASRATGGPGTDGLPARWRSGTTRRNGGPSSTPSPCWNGSPSHEPGTRPRTQGPPSGRRRRGRR